MTEAQIENHVERQMNILDKNLLSGKITQKEYEIDVKFLDAWARRQLKKRNNG